MSGNGRYYGYLTLSLLCVAVLYFFFRKTRKVQEKVTFREELERINLSKQQRAFLYAVANHETGRFTSELYVKHNNAFGMKVSRRRERYWHYEAGSYAGYSNVRSSIDDIIGWFQFHGEDVPNHPVTGSRMMKRKGYYEQEEELYTNAVTYYYNEYISKDDW